MEGRCTSLVLPRGRCHCGNTPSSNYHPPPTCGGHVLTGADGPWNALGMVTTPPGNPWGMAVAMEVWLVPMMLVQKSSCDVDERHSGLPRATGRGRHAYVDKRGPREPRGGAPERGRHAESSASCGGKATATGSTGKRGLNVFITGSEPPCAVPLHHASLICPGGKNK